MSELLHENRSLIVVISKENLEILPPTEFPSGSCNPECLVELNPLLWVKVMVDQGKL